MMRYILYILLLFLAQASYAQQRPLFSQYMHNPYLLNPAVAGEDFATARTSYRKQWSGLSGAPQSYYLTVQGPLIIAGAATRTTLPMLGKSVLSSFKVDTVQAKPAKVRHGIGLTLISDKMGPTRLHTALLSYAAHFRLSETMKMSLGLSVGGRQWKLDPNELDFESGSDPVVGSAVINKLLPSMSLGAMLYSKKFFLGISTEQILQSKLDFGTVVGGIEPGRLRRHFYATAGYSILVNSLTFTPSVMFRYALPVAPALDVNLKVAYKELLWIGTSYRIGTAMAFLAGFKAGKRLMVGYSYDLSMGNSKDMAQNTHEVVLGLRLGDLTK